MKAILGTITIGAVGAALAMNGVASLIGQRTRHLKENYRGRTLVATGGLALVFPLLLGAAGVASDPRVRVASLVALAGAPFVMAMLGLIDDLYGNRHAGGLGGHARELLRGHLTTGMVKAVGGAVIGIVAAVLLGHRGLWAVVGGAVIAMSANLANLLDLRPARATKVWAPLAVAMLIYLGDSLDGRVLASVLGGALVFAFYELREVVMLGDTGANLLGAVLGTAAVAAFSRPAMGVAAGVLLALTLLAEVVSFSRVIAAVPPLRWVDELGRRP